MADILLPPSSCNVYTPAILANAMVQTLGDFSGARWLEPCIGKGSFLESLSMNHVARGRITGVDLATNPERADRLATVRRSTEFLAWAARTRASFDRIVANPPFISLSNLPKEIQQAARRHCCPNGKPVPLASNCWHAFFCACLKLLKPRGSLAFVLPAAFEYANYAASLRNMLPREFAQFEVHRCRRPLFDRVEDGAVVVIARHRGSAKHEHKRVEYESLEDLVCGIQECRGPNSREPACPSDVQNGRAVPLRNVMSIGIGAVTGDARYFLMTEDERLDHDLPVSAMRRVVSRSRHVTFGTISRHEWESLRAIGERVWLFRPDGDALEHPSVKRYLSRPANRGGCRKDALKIRNRSPWFLTPIPAYPHGFLSGMCQHGPAICLNGMRSLSTTNTLYTVRFHPSISRQARTAWAAMLLTSSTRQQLSKISRRYALGLTKYEPGDIQSLILPMPEFRSVTDAKYQQAIEALIGGNLHESQSIADSCITVD